MRKIALSLFASAALMAVSLMSPQAALAGGGHGGGAAKKPDTGWSFKGYLGTFDRGALQRGFQVYREVCANCHGLDYIAFRNLPEIGLSEAQAKAIAADYEVDDGPNDEGEMFKRPAKLSDYWPSPYANAAAARAANNGAYPPDLSLLEKARPDGANYIYGVLTGYEEAPHGFEVPEMQYYNKAFPGHLISMGPPLTDHQVGYTDGSPETVKQYSKDVVTFLAWASHPELEERKRLGWRVLLWLGVFTVLMYFVKRRVWADLH